MTWDIKNGKLVRDFAFSNFLEAISFVNKVAELAEDADHHPDILIHDYKFVTVSLVSHDVSSITDKDHSLAEKIDALKK
ncbi:MAG: 4a-hydroxytetrahydrobiopterin dehydratase [Candidatus Woesearchaeota archaeon]